MLFAPVILEEARPGGKGEKGGKERKKGEKEKENTEKRCSETQSSNPISDAYKPFQPAPVPPSSCAQSFSHHNIYDVQLSSQSRL